MKKNQMGVFEAIATVHFYFCADPCYEQEAKNAFSWLEKHPEEAGKYLDDLSVFKFCLDDVDFKVFQRAYYKIFEEVVLSQFPQFVPCRDDYARGFYYRRNIYLRGNDEGEYPYYQSKTMLLNRLKKLKIASWNEVIA